MTSHQSSEDLLQPGHIVKVLIIPVIVIIMVVITVIVVVVNVINTVIFMVMSRSDGKWRERSVEVASARSTRASTSSPRSRLTNPFLKYKHPHWNYHHQEHTLIPQFLYKMLKKSIFILTEEGEWKNCFLPRKSLKTSSPPRWGTFCDKKSLDI